jgi:hypothetical protein
MTAMPHFSEPTSALQICVISVDRRFRHCRDRARGEGKKSLIGRSVTITSQGNDAAVE